MKRWRCECGGRDHVTPDTVRNSYCMTCGRWRTEVDQEQRGSQLTWRTQTDARVRPEHRDPPHRIEVIDMIGRRSYQWDDDKAN